MCAKDAEDEDRCDFAQWADQPRDLGPLRLNVDNLVAEGFPQPRGIGADSIVRGAKIFSESIYYMAADVCAMSAVNEFILALTANGRCVLTAR